jgi:hypothetical protein
MMTQPLHLHTNFDHIERVTNENSCWQIYNYSNLADVINDDAYYVECEVLQSSWDG